MTTSPPIEDPPSKTVDRAEAKLGDTLTYTITQFVPYTSDDAAYTSLIFTDVLISSASVNVYRADTLKGTSQTNDTSNWKISVNKTMKTIVADHNNPVGAGGTYEFVIMVDVIDSDSDLVDSETSTTSGG